MIPLADARIVFVGGKGGVGKTTMASALGLRLASGGRRCLLVSTDPAHSLGDVFDREIGDRPTELAPGLTGLELDPDREVDRYLTRVRENMQGFVRPGLFHEIERHLELARQAPGAVEAATMDRMAELMAEDPDDRDVVIFDTAPTGHTLRLLSLPEIMAAWTDGMLRRRERSDSLGSALDRLSGRRRGTGGAGAVGGGVGGGGGERGEGGEDEAGAPAEEAAPGSAGDELSWFDQTEEGAGEDRRTRRIREVLLERRRKLHRARRLLLDRDTTMLVWVLIPERLAILETEKAVRVLREFGVPPAVLVVNRVLPEGELGRFLEARREREAGYLRRIDELFADLPRVRVPLLGGDVEGVEGLEEIGRHLGPGGTV